LHAALNVGILQQPQLFAVARQSAGTPGNATPNTAAQTQTILIRDGGPTREPLAGLLELWFETGRLPPGLSGEQIVQRNRLLLETVLPQWVRPRGEIRRACVHASDQAHRLIWLGGALLVFFVSSLRIDPNTTSLHEYYRDRLGFAFLGEPLDGSGSPRMSLAECRPHDYGAPLPLFGAAVCEQSPVVHPTQLEAPFTKFLLSPEYSGSERHGYILTSDFVPETELSVADTMAISGAALSPNYFVHHIVMAVMALLNLRMGKWLPNPASAPLKHFRPRLWSQARADLQADVKSRRYLQVTDGGHVENLGLGELLDRRCRLIILSDAGQDARFEFTDFARLMRRYRTEEGIEFFELDGATRLDVTDRFPQPFVPREKPEQRAAREAIKEVFSDTDDVPLGKRRHFFAARIRYPNPNGGDPNWGLLLYVKPCLTGTEDADLYNYALRFPKFPHDPTADQAFSDAQFESYRRLGVLSGEDLCRRLISSPDQLWKVGEFHLTVLEAALGVSALSEETSLINRLMDDVQSPDEDRSRQARSRLLEFGDQAAVATRRLLEIYLGGTVHTRNVARQMLTNFQQQGLAALAQLIRDPHVPRELAKACADILGDYLADSNHQQFVDDLLRDIAQQHLSGKVRKAAARALAQRVPQGGDSGEAEQKDEQVPLSDGDP
jgi:hypothetical protein